MLSTTAQAALAGVSIDKDGSSINLPYTGNSQSATISITNTSITANTTFPVVGELYASDGTKLSTRTVTFILTGDQTQTPTITLTPQVLNLKQNQSTGITLQVSNVSTIPSYRWFVSIYGFNGTNVDPRYDNAFVISPESGDTQSSTIQITNNSVTSGTVTIHATLTGSFPSSPILSNEVVVNCLPDTNYSIDVFQWTATSVAYRESADVKFRLKNGNESVIDSSITWTLTTTQQWMSNLVRYSPSSSGNFGSQSDKTVTIYNETNLYASTAVTFVIKAWSGGSIIAQSTTDMTMTLVPNVIITILNPEPSYGGNASLEIGAAGGTFSDGAVEFRSNVA